MGGKNRTLLSKLVNVSSWLLIWKQLLKDSFIGHSDNQITPYFLSESIFHKQTFFTLFFFFSFFFSNLLDTHISLFDILNFLREAGTPADRSSLDSPDCSTGVHDLVEAQELHEESKLSPP